MAQEISNLQGWWKLDNNSTDSSDNSNNGSDTDITYQTGKVNQSAVFNGTSSKITISPSSLTIQSVAFWMNATSNNSDIIKLSSSAKVSVDGSNNISTTGLSNAVITTYGNRSDTSGVISTGTWYLVVVTFDQITTSAIELGHETSYYEGQLDDVRVYDKILTSVEKVGLYNNDNGIKTNNLVRIFYEKTGLLGNDVVSTSDLIIQDQDELDNILFTIIPTYQVVSNDEFKFYDYNNECIFAGYIKNVNSDNVKEIKGYEYLMGYKSRIVNDIFTNVSPESLFQTMVEDYAPDSEFTFSSTISSGVTLPLYVSKNKSALEVMQDMAELLKGTVFYSTVDKVIKLEFVGSTTSSSTIQEGVNANNVSGILQDPSKQVTVLKLIGDKQVDTKTDSYTASASQTDFALSEIPLNIEVTVNGTAQTLQVDGQTTGDFTLDRENKVISFITPLTGGEAVVIKYNFEINIEIEADASKSIKDTYGTIDRKITKKFLKTMSEARDYADDYLEKYAIPLKSATYKISTTLNPNNFVQGNSIFVEDFSYRDIEGVQLSENLIIRKIRRQYPQGGLSITVGENESNMIQWGKELTYNIKQLYAEDNNSTVIQKYQQIVNNIKITYTVEFTTLQTKAKGDAWILDDVTNSQIDSTFKLDGGSITSYL